MIIALSGKKGSGKSTSADYLEKHHNFIKLSFATPLKHSLSSYFEIGLTNFYDEPKKDSRLRTPITLDFNTIISYLERLGDLFGPGVTTKLVYRAITDRTLIEHRISGLVIDTPRKLMQIIATDIIRNIEPHLWVDYMEKSLETIVSTKGEANFVIDDLRFYNERSMVMSRGGVIVNIRRDSSDKIVDNHESENGVLFDFEIMNNSITKLKQDIDLTVDLARLL